MTKNTETAAATAAATAAIVGNDIAWIKKDLGEIKIGLTTMSVKQEEKIDTLSRIVYTGVGVSIALSVLLKFVIK